MMINLFDAATWPVPEVHEIEVWLNGRKLHGVIKADDELGLVQLTCEGDKRNVIDPEEYIKRDPGYQPSFRENIILIGNVEFRRNGVALR